MPNRILFCLCLWLIPFAAQAVTVRQFSPQGRVDQQTRITASFSGDMVRLGETGTADPFDINCGEVNGRGWWSDSRTWAYQMARPLNVGERCEFKARAGLAALNGEALDGKRSFEIAAAGPFPRFILPQANTAVDEEQIFIINAGTALDNASLQTGMWCEADGVGNRIPVQVIEGEPRREVLDHAYRYHYRNLTGVPAVVRCAERLPPGAKIKLVWSRTVASSSGARSDREDSFVYSVREPFRATLSCEREKAGAPCSPLSAITIDFSAHTEAKLLGKARLVTSEGTRSPRDPDRDSSTHEKTRRSIVFAGPFPQQAEMTLELPAGIADDAGRPLANAASFPLKFKTGNLPPLAKFSGSFGIVELKEGGLLPVTLRNVEANLPLAQQRLPEAAKSGGHNMASQRLTEDSAVIATMRRLSKFEQETRLVTVMRDGRAEEYRDPYYARELPFLGKDSGVERSELPRPGGKEAFEVVGIPLAKPGYYVVEIESRLLGAALLSTPKPMYVRTTALVTNMAVHFKKGRDNALVWVTALDSGKPLANAAVRISDCNGKELWQGKTDAQGRALAEQALVAPLCKEESFFFVSARLGNDYSFVRSDWNEGIESWRFGVETWGEPESQRFHTVFDRTLFRPGQTVSMKHIARMRDSRGFRFPDADALPNKLTVRHSGDGTEYTLPLVWDSTGSATSQWPIPQAAKRGTYEVLLAGGKHGTHDSGEFRVSDFRLPVFTGSVQGAAGRMVAPEKVPLALGLSFLNGGAAKNAPVEVSATLRPRWPSYPHYDRFNFTTGFSSEMLLAFGIDGGREREQLVLDKQALRLDAAGAGKLEVKLPQKPKGPSELYAEMTFTDPNGEIQTLHGSVELWPAAVTLGMNVGEWTANRGEANRIEVVALDNHGRPLAGQEIKVRGKRRVDYSHRRRIVGGFYAYENTHEFIDLGTVCSGRTDTRGLFFCQPQNDVPGSVYLLAETRDTQGNIARATGGYWVTGSGDLWFAAGNQDRIDVIPEQRSYKPGETARLQVRTPFREATALISIEAAGIIETRVQTLSRFDPVIELPVKAEWGPNVYVSVLAVRGRIEPLKWTSFFHWGWREPISWFKAWWNPQQPTAMVDLAKPAYRVGLAEFGVGVDGFRLNVEVTADKKDYRPRDTATVKLKVTGADGKPAAAGSEVAFAAVDQALLELRPNESWKLLEAFLQKRPYEVETATAQSQVIGKRHFGKKALPPGGGGGRAPARELFDTLLLWQPRVALDASGSATLKVPMNDSLSEFRLVGVATSGAGLFGTGSSAVRTKQDLQMVSGMPPLVREKDGVVGLLTVRNGTTRTMTVEVSAKLDGKLLNRQKITLPAEGADELNWNTQVAEGVSQQVWEFEAQEAGSGNARDALRIVQQVAPAVPVTVQQASFTRIEGKYEVPVTLPGNALPGKGGIEIGLSPKLSTPPPGLKRFFEEYPFTCLEQKASIAVGLNDRQRWQQVVEQLPAYLDSNGLANYFPGSRGYVTLTAYLLDMSAISGLALPDEVKSRMLQGLLAFAEGRIRQPEYWTPQEDMLARKLTALEAITRQGIVNAAPTRVAAALFGTDEPELLRLPTAALIDWALIVRRLPELPKRAARLAAAEQELRNRLSYVGGRLAFTTEKSDVWWWMMVSGDSNAFRLIEAMHDQPHWQEDMPRLMRGAIERQTRGRWFTTTANAWAAVTLKKFGDKFEKVAVQGTTRASLGGASRSLVWGTLMDQAPPAPLHLAWPAKTEDAKLSIQHEGSGQPWAAIQVLAAVPSSSPRAYGYKVTRQVTPLQEKVAGKVSRGDLWRVRLNVEAEQDMSWVVLSDPIPAGARILGEGDGRDSRIATQGEDRLSRRVWPTFVERTFDFYRAYYEVVPRGSFSIEYTLRINNAGEFGLPPTRVEAMYAPDVFGEAPNARVLVQP